MRVSPSATSKLLDSHWDGMLPVNVFAIARALGIKVESDRTMAESGVIERTDSGTVIRYNVSEPTVRQRFTLAHEIGHYSLGHLTVTGTKYRDTVAEFSNGAESAERQANAFAIELLMPEKVVKFAVNEKGYRTIEALADLFGVSQVAMKCQLLNLGLLPA